MPKPVQLIGTLIVNGIEQCAKEDGQTRIVGYDYKAKKISYIPPSGYFVPPETFEDDMTAAIAKWCEMNGKPKPVLEDRPIEEPKPKKITKYMKINVFNFHAVINDGAISIVYVFDDDFAVEI
mgnify:FL=1